VHGEEALQHLRAADGVEALILKRQRFLEGADPDVRIRAPPPGPDGRALRQLQARDLEAESPEKRQEGPVTTARVQNMVAPAATRSGRSAASRRTMRSADVGSPCGGA
jgi:hypothetical protein